MEIRASHHFARDIDDVWAMFLDPDAHVAKYQHMGHRDVEVVSSSGDDAGLSIEIVRQVDIEVPALAKKFINPSNTVTSTDRWELDVEVTDGGRTEPRRLTCSFLHLATGYYRYDEGYTPDFAGRDDFDPRCVGVASKGRPAPRRRRGAATRRRNPERARALRFT